MFWWEVGVILSDDELQSLRVARGRIEGIRAASQPGVSEGELRNISPALRDLFENHFHSAWRSAGMPQKTATIPSLRLEGADEPQRLYLFGGRDTPQPDPVVVDGVKFPHTMGF